MFATYGNSRALLSQIERDTAAKLEWTFGSALPRCPRMDSVAVIGIVATKPATCMRRRWSPDILASGETDAERTPQR